MVGAGVQISEVWGRAAAAMGARAAGRGQGARYMGLQFYRVAFLNLCPPCWLFWKAAALRFC
ncbi:hypothetical protein E2562_021362 [Oryza meyeriana var. granulata]|uniref:Uncharacterized protein n=1 Tax=Oryza meyeriana var. granulata TaxID=110450 RepID=A0A6G1CJ68_9ORYZ|nr:hypothetical protein E2562_021362 [Oryza meyeriana var. granulata]